MWCNKSKLLIKMPKCRLCNEDKSLVDSHIFPEFMYVPLYDDEHRFKVINLQGGDIIKEPPKGIYEKLLCDNCDNKIIGKYEDHASKVLFGDGKKEIEIETKKYGQLIHNVDYKLFKLFQISLIWRASISTRKEVIRIDLGPHAEKMRQMLLEENPGEIYEYGVIIYLFPKSSKDMKDLIISPELLPKRIEGNRIYRAIFNGLSWIYFVSSHLENFRYKELFLSKDGSLPIINSGQIGEDFVLNMAKDLSNRKIGQ